MYGGHASECLYLPKPPENILWGCGCNSPIATEMSKEYWSFFFFLVTNISQYTSSRQNGRLGICSPAFTPAVSAEHDLALTVPMLFKFQLLKTTKV